MDEIDNGKDKFGLAAWDSLSIWKQFTAFIFNIISVLDKNEATAAKGEKASPRE